MTFFFSGFLVVGSVFLFATVVCLDTLGTIGGFFDFSGFTSSLFGVVVII